MRPRSPLCREVGRAGRVAGDRTAESDQGQSEPVARSTASTMSVTTASQASFFPGTYMGRSCSRCVRTASMYRNTSRVEIFTGGTARVALLLARARTAGRSSAHVRHSVRDPGLPALLSRTEAERGIPRRRRVRRGGFRRVAGGGSPRGRVGPSRRGAAYRDLPRAHRVSDRNRARMGVRADLGGGEAHRSGGDR